MHRGRDDFIEAGGYTHKATLTTISITHSVHSEMELHSE